MRKHFLVPIVIALLGLTVLLNPGSTATILAQDTDAAIRIRDVSFRPGLGESPNLPLGLTISNYAQNSRGYYIVQFNGPVEAHWKNQVAAEGGELLGYIPDFAFKVRMNPAQANRIAALPTVNWVGIFQPAYKLSSTIDLNSAGLYQIRVERGADAGLARAAIARSGATVLGRDGQYITVAAEANQIVEIANVVDVAWIENFVLKEKHNEYGAGVIMGANTANASGYDGSTQTVAVADTGLGDGTTTGAHPDIPAGRIESVHNWPGVTDTCFQTIVDDGAIDVDSAHGTHVAGSVLSDGGAGGLGKGTAPAASLVFQATENYAFISNFCQVFGGWPAEGYFLTGLPDDLNNLYQQAYNDGARIHANSWGSSQAGVYTANSAQTDQFIWNNPDMTVTFSAGNAGADANNNGVVDNDSIGSPATAKNVITIGASENERPDNFPCDSSLTYTSRDAYQSGQTCGSMGGTNILGTAGQRWGFTAEPLNSDVTAGNQEQMAPFSSRGPTDDGRIKPDVVAPGTWILSTFSDLYQQGYGDPVNPQINDYQYDGWGMPYNGLYKYMGGTSMSNPLAAGAAAVVRDYYQEAHTHSASAALVKAIMINTAVDLLDENNDGANDNDFPIPNVHEGWGRIDVANATDGSEQYVDDLTGLNTGGSATTQYAIATAGQPFKVTLVWSDYPSTEAAAQNLVNDLDLIVTAPGGAQYRGNVFSGGWSITGGSADRVNNVENVYVQSAAAGTWTVEVSGFNVPQGSQPFALVVGGAFGAVDGPPSVTVTAPADGSTVSGTINVAATASDDNGVTQVEFFVNGGSIGVDTTAPYATSWDSTTVGDGSHTISAVATDTIGQTGSDAVIVNVDNLPDPTVHVGDLDGSSASAPKNRWNATVTIAVHDAVDAPVAGATVDGTWSVGGSGSCVTNGVGTCSITKNNIKGNFSSTNFDVTNIAISGSAYTPGNNHDPDGDSNGTTITVSKPGSNNAPTVAISAPTDGSTFTSGASISFSGSASDTEDGSLTSSLVWTSSIDGQIGTGGSFSTVLSDGSHTITASVTDSGGASGSDSVGVTVGTVMTVVMHVGDLDGSNASAPRNRWDATVVVVVHDTTEGPVANATVNGSWSVGGGGSCTTDAAGVCSITKNNIKGNNGSATFTVSSITRNAGDSYNSGANHDPDGDSSGTAITITKP